MTNSPTIGGTAISPEFRKAMDRAARKAGMSRSDWIRRTLAEALGLPPPPMARRGRPRLPKK